MNRFVFVAVLTLAFTAAGNAQTQIGGHYSALALEYPEQTRSGIGAFFVYSPREWIGLDVGTTFFVSEDVGGSVWQLLAGPRVGGHVAGLAIFGRVRPGLIRFSERFYAPEVVCIAIFPPPESCLAGATNFAVDLGGTIEVPLSSSTVLRLDLSDTLTRYRSNPRPQSDSGEDGYDRSWKHGLQFVAGAGWKF
jgi:hypothetical protein